MPAEPLQCPNCGSADVRQCAPDSYACEHCRTSFRWVDPTSTTVLQRLSVCQCGNVAVAFCVRCHTPLCEKHKSKGWGGRGWGFLVNITGVASGSPSECRQAFEKYRIPQQQGVLCSKCNSECEAALDRLSETHQQNLHGGGAALQVCSAAENDTAARGSGCAGFLLAILLTSATLVLLVL